MVRAGCGACERAFVYLRMGLDPRRIEVIDDRVAAILRAMPLIETVRLAEGMMLEARETLRHLVRSEHADWSEAAVEAEVARRYGGTVVHQKL